jgi:hypothetical protein
MAEKSSTALWKETTAITKDLVKEGQVAYKVSGWECDHCKVKVWNKDASRLAFHLSGDVGLRDAGNGFTGIGVCLQVPSDVADRTKIEMAAKAAKKARKSSLSATGQVMASEEGDLQMKTVARQKARKLKEEQREARHKERVDREEKIFAARKEAQQKVKEEEAEIRAQAAAEKRAASALEKEATNMAKAARLAEIAAAKQVGKQAKQAKAAQLVAAAKEVKAKAKAAAKEAKAAQLEAATEAKEAAKEAKRDAKLEAKALEAAARSLVTFVQAAKKLKRLPAAKGAAAQPSAKKPKKWANSAELSAARPGQKRLKG